MNIEKIEALKTEYEKVEMSSIGYQKMLKKMEKAKKDKRRQHKSAVRLIIAAAALIIVVALPNTSATVAYAMGNIPVVGSLFRIITFRSYEYESEQKHMSVDVPQIEVLEENDTQTAEQADASSEQINNEIQELTDKWTEAFKTNMEQEGFEELNISSEVIKTAPDYFTLKLVCYQAQASGYEEDHYYTIDLKTGERKKLSDFFTDNSDYKKIISDNIKEQMQKQMDEGEEKIYWINSEDFPESNFKEISDDAEFYIDESNQFVICFYEGEVAPMYMGNVSFTIPVEVTNPILKEGL